MKFIPPAAVAAILVLALIGCGRDGEAAAGKTLRDRDGGSIAVPAKTERIISMAPSNTEIIAALGLADRLIAVDAYSAGVEGIPGGLPLIDFSYPDAEALISLAPDIILASGHNQTVTGDDPLRLIGEAGIPVVYITVSGSIGEIYEDIAFIAEIFGVPERGAALVDAMRSQIEGIAKIGASIENKKSVYFELSPAPYLYSLGRDTFINEMIEVVGAKNIFAGVSGWLAPAAEVIIEKNPDVILTSVNFIDNPLEELRTRKGFEHIRAVVNGEIYQIDANAAARPSQRIVIALNQMAKAVYPDKYAE
jgi:iron complex transport system substrate-binding protein